MASKGAPKGNTNARKEATGRRLVVYLSADDLSLLRYVLQKYGHEDTSDAACLDLARKAAKAGINNLLNPEYYEIATKRVLNEERNKKMVAQKEFQKQINATLNAFIVSPEFESGCTSATKASWGGSGYSVELFPEGHWRVLWDNEIGNKYESRGVILSLPTINDDEYQQLVNEEGMEEDEFFNLGFGNEYDDLAKELRDHLSDDFAMSSN